MKFRVCLPTGFEAVMHPVPFVEPIDFVRLGQACDDVARAAEKAGMRRGDVVLIYTGIGRLWDTLDYWRTVIPIAPKAVRWLLERDVKVFGVDRDEIDRNVLTWPAHQLLREHEFYIIENVNLWAAVLDLPRRFTFYGLPLPLEGATAAPVRAVAQMTG
jgi:kynurenine formamidase